MNAVEFMFKQSNWKIPKLVAGEEIRFNYWNSEFDNWYGVRGTVLKIRYLSAKPLKRKDKEMVRGSVQYIVWTNYGVKSFYNQRMANVEKIQRKKLTSLESGV